MGRATIYVFAKPPRAGVAKTRLAVSVGPEMAATYARAFLHDVWDVVARVPSADAVLAVTANDREAYGLGDDIETVLQGEGDLGVRMARVLALGLSRGDKAIIVGSDCPGVGEETFTRVRDALETHDAFLAPTDDGGFYLVGVRRCPEGIFDGVPWSVATTFVKTRARMEALGLRVAVGEPWIDVDDVEGLEVLRSRLVEEPARAVNAARTCALLEDATRPLAGRNER